MGSSDLLYLSQGIVLLALTASIDSLRPQQICKNDSGFCMNPTKAEFALLYGGITLASKAMFGTCSSIGSSLLCTLGQ